MPSRRKLIKSFAILFNEFCFCRLSEIHAVSQARGKALRDERDQRHRQMAILQQDTSRMPHEAISEIVGDYSGE